MMKILHTTDWHIGQLFHECYRKVWCIAAPFQKMGDYPIIANCYTPYSEGLEAFYKKVFEYLCPKKVVSQARIVFRHLQIQQAVLNHIDKMEQLDMGGSIIRHQRFTRAFLMSRREMSTKHKESGHRIYSLLRKPTTLLFLETS